jgi:hypothetical protein
MRTPGVNVIIDEEELEEEGGEGFEVQDGSDEEEEKPRGTNHPRTTLERTN